MKHFSVLQAISIVLVVATFAYVVLADATPTLYPTADGTNDSADWKNTGGISCDAADCYTEVDETTGGSCGGTSDGNTSFIVSSTQGAHQTFSLDTSSIPVDSTITAVEVHACERAVNDPANSIQLRYCVDGSCSDSGAPLTASADYTDTSQTFSGLSITRTPSTQLEAGVSITGSTGRNVRVSSISAILTYTTPSNGDETEVVVEGGTPPTVASFSGLAYPSSTVEVLWNSPLEDVFRNTPTVKEEIDGDGVFLNRYSGLLGGKYIFFVRARDVDGKTSSTVSFDIDFISENELIVEDIFFSPTLGFEEDVVSQGDDMHIVGYAGGGNTVQLEIEGMGTEETTALPSGFYEFYIDTTSLSAGNHSARVRQVAGTDEDPDSIRTSNFSPYRVFRVGTCCIQTDFNGDNKVNIIDWSIFLFHWGSENKSLRARIDLNGDGRVDVADFSLFLLSVTKTIM